MKQISIILLSVLLLNLSCKKTKQNNIQNTKSFTVKGYVKNTPENTYVKLLLRGANSIKTVDSCLIIDSKFSLKGANNGIDFYVLSFTNNPYFIYLLIDSADNILIKANFDTLPMYKVQNSKESKFIQHLENHIFKTNISLSKANKNVEEIKNNQINFSKQFIKKHKYSLACIIALSEKFLDGKPVLPIEKNYDLFKKTEKNLEKKYSDTQYFREFQNFIKNYEIVKSRNRRIGNKPKPKFFVNFQATTIDNKKFSLSKYKGKTILLSFGSSWCTTCKQNNTVLKEIENKNKNIKIVQIFLDLSKNILNDTIKKYNFNHTIIQDSNMWDSKIIEKYQVDKLPTNIIISPKGKIIFYSSIPKELAKKFKINRI
jgi:thiol-disulfide isomerase/thioredoxin